MYWYRHLYCDKKCKLKLNRIKRKLNDRLVHKGVYIISLNEGGGLMDIIYSPLLLQKSYPVKDLKIVGVADSHESACDLVSDIIMDCMKAGYNFNIGEYMNRSGE